MKTQTVIGTTLVAFGAVLVGVVFAPMFRQVIQSPEQRGELTQYQPGSSLPYRADTAQFIQPPAKTRVQVPVQQYAPPRMPPVAIHHTNQRSSAPQLAAEQGAVAQVAAAAPVSDRNRYEAKPIPVQRYAPPATDHYSTEPPMREVSSSQQLPTLDLPDLELPELELPEQQSLELELPVAVNWGEETPQGEYSQVRDNRSVLEEREVSKRVVSVRPLPSHQVPTVRGVAGYEPTSKSEATLTASRIPQRTTQAIRIQNAGYEARARYVPESIEKMSFEAANPGPEMRSIRQPNQSQNQQARQIRPVVGGSLQQSQLKRLRVSPQIEKRLAEHIKYGESLTRRQSFLAAREEFTLALLLIAGSHKTAARPEAYSKQLAQALTALDESSDFVALKRGGATTALTQRIMSHKTRLISPDQVSTINPTRALDLYCGFAQSQIETAIGYSVGGSQALHALGKLETISPQSGARTSGVGQARALVFFRAAMSVDPNNAVCSNDLGVLLYDLGRLREAEEAIKVSLGKSQSKMAWENLSMVHRQSASNTSGEERNRQVWLANLASKEVQNFAGEPVATLAGDQWATAAEFENRAAFPGAVSGVPAGEQRFAPPIQNQRSAASALLQKVKRWHQ